MKSSEGLSSVLDYGFEESKDLLSPIQRKYLEIFPEDAEIVLRFHKGSFEAFRKEMVELYKKEKQNNK